jgi:hypothetical protein
MSKRFVITEEEKNNIKSLYNINEQEGNIVDLALKYADEAIQKRMNQPGGPFANQTLSTTSSDTKVSNSSLPTKTTPDDDFYKKVLSCVGAKPTKDNMSFMYAWRQAEGGKASNNPFNTTHKMPGSTKYQGNTAGVQNYKNSEDGIQATCKTLNNGRYNDIVNGLKNDVGLFQLSRMKGLKTWGTGELLAKVADGYLKGSSPKPQAIA